VKRILSLLLLGMAVIVGASAQSTATGNGANTRSVQYGAFCRAGGFSPYAMGTPTGATSPSPYPSWNGNLNTYLYGPDGAGNSIDSANPIDPQKLKNLVDTGAQWCRNEDAPYEFDETHIFNTPTYSWGFLDSVLGELKNVGITPVVGTEIGGVLYNDSIGGFTIVEHNRYDNPADFATFCGVLANHVSTIFGDHRYSIPGNEINGDAASADVIGGLNGAPPPPVVIAVSGGTLSTSTAQNYEIAPLINGIEGIPSAPYYSNVTPSSGKQSLQVTWGPSAAETGGYNVYRLTSGVYKLLTTVAHGVTTFTDTGSLSVGTQTPQTTSLATTGAFEADYAAYNIPCYQAIKAADPLAFVYGLELNMVVGLTPQPATFVSDLISLGCGPGTCYDGISLHLYPAYPMPGLTTPCLSDGGTDYSLACLQDIEQAAGPPIPLMIGEYAVTVPGVVSSEATAALAITDALTKFASYPYTRYVAYANVDECPLYSSGFFLDGCLVTAAQKKQLRWSSAQSIFTAITGAVGNGGGGTPP
jgi:hypothetical protein